VLILGKYVNTQEWRLALYSPDGEFSPGLRGYKVVVFLNSKGIGGYVEVFLSNFHCATFIMLFWGSGSDSMAKAGWWCQEKALAGHWLSTSTLLYGWKDLLLQWVR